MCRQLGDVLALLPGHHVVVAVCVIQPLASSAAAGRQGHSPQPTVHSRRSAAAALAHGLAVLYRGAIMSSLGRL